MPKIKPFEKGDLVFHFLRGDGVFETYSRGRKTCFVKFIGGSESEQVTTDMVRHRTRVPKPVKCANCGKPKGDHQARIEACPVGRKHRDVGYTQYSAALAFRPKK